jgi:hypothetical protein
MEGGGPTSWKDLRTSDIGKCSLLGLVESTPMFGSWLVSVWFYPESPAWLWVILGAMMCLSLCWLLRHRTPPSVIHAASVSLTKPGNQIST